MEYESKIATSPRGLSQEQALAALQENPKFKAGTRIRSIERVGDRWSIKIDEPKVAAGPPFGDDEDDEGGPPSPDPSIPSPDEKPSADDEGDGEKKPPFDKKDKGEEKGDLDIAVILPILEAIAEKLGIGKPDALEDPLAPGPDGPPDGPPGPPAGPPGHKGPPPGHPLKPGEAPPGSTPIGTPAFASVQEMAGVIPSFTASTKEPITVKQAKHELEEEYGPYYKVKQASRKDGALNVLLAVR
jgi:hypothetical protein